MDASNRPSGCALALSHSTVDIGGAIRLSTSVDLRRVELRSEMEPLFRYTCVTRAITKGQLSVGDFEFRPFNCSGFTAAERRPLVMARIFGCYGFVAPPPALAFASARRVSTILLYLARCSVESKMNSSWKTCTPASSAAR